MMWFGVSATGVALSSSVGAFAIRMRYIGGVMPAEGSVMFSALTGVIEGIATSGIATMLMTAVFFWRRAGRVGRPSGLHVARLLLWLPPSMRDDAEGLIREFADVRDRDRARGGAPWWTMLKCAWFLACYVLRAALALAFAALVGRLLRL